ncbi:hypothetical protein K9B32_23265 [Rhizobium sp. 3T7]|uniref:hypothetical protein n=1 Tax=Rhizobium sp. 3T7 TaxID=2874922 RepID=UPI001CCC54CF|nr:hypothetical protein [Rhizobium sp. 3T7]MBZ9792986.1 hypothetical protein [Rhizobium sp. 3T7]
MVEPSGVKEMGDRVCQSRGWCSIFNDEVAGVYIEIKPPVVRGSNFEMRVSCDHFTCSLEGGKTIAQLNQASQPMRMTFYNGGISLGLELRRGEELGKLILMVKRFRTFDRIGPTGDHASAGTRQERSREQIATKSGNF